MATTQILKKKLNGVRSIQKMSKALKTASMVKFSQLSEAYGNYEVYSERCRHLYEQNQALFEGAFPKGNDLAPVCFVVMAANKGMCGSFNSDIFHFATEQINDEENCRIILIGGWLKNWFEENKLHYDRALVFDDLPTYDDTADLYGVIKEMLTDGSVSGVELIYPEFQNVMNQPPARCTLLGKAEERGAGVQPLFFPDRGSVVSGMADTVLTSVLHKKVLECAMGAQAATLMTMRSAYDTASEYSQQLEAEINQKRQNQVTSDVIETSAEFSREEDEL